MLQVKIYVIIVTYNGLSWIDACLNSVINSTLPVKTVMIDNCSTDGSVEYVRNRYQDVEIIALDENVGFGQANNIGIKEAYDEGADYVYLLNQDAWIMPETIEDLVKIMNSNPEIGILGPMQLDATKKNVDRLFYKDIILNEITLKEMVTGFVTGEINDYYYLDYFPAAHWLLSRKCISEVGLFSPSFFHYGEDTNYMKRAHFHGICTAIAPKVSVVHDRGGRKKPDFVRLIFNQYNDSIENASNIETSITMHYIYMIKFAIFSVFYYFFISSVDMLKLNINGYNKKLTPLRSVVRFYRLSKKKGFLLEGSK